MQHSCGLRSHNEETDSSCKYAFMCEHFQLNCGWSAWSLVLGRVQMWLDLIESNCIVETWLWFSNVKCNNNDTSFYVVGNCGDVSDRNLVALSVCGLAWLDQVFVATDVAVSFEMGEREWYL